jgi:hypothetical protein
VLVAVSSNRAKSGHPGCTAGLPDLRLYASISVRALPMARPANALVLDPLKDKHDEVLREYKLASVCPPRIGRVVHPVISRGQRSVNI